MRILHISDLHFGVEVSKERTGGETPVRSYDINDLTANLGGITETEPLDYIFITGDIVYTATEAAYEEAGRWLARLSKTCDVPTDRIYLSLGNCDSGQTGAENPRRYDDFCRSMGLPSYVMGRKENYTAGVAVTPYMNVICLDAKWFGENGADNGSREAVFELEQRIRKEQGFTKGRPVILFMHHAVSGRCGNRAVKDSGGICACEELCGMADMVLTDHAHGRENSCGYQSSAYICKNGAIYQTDTTYCYFHIYEWDHAGQGPIACSRTVYRFDGMERNREANRLKLTTYNSKVPYIRIENGEAKAAKKPLQYSFSVLWWTR